MDNRQLELVVISLPQARDRRLSVSGMLRNTAWERAPLRWCFFDALRGPSGGLRYDEAGTRARFGRSLTPGELGCYSSHHASLVDFLRSEESGYRMIIEDDMLLDPGFPFAQLPDVMHQGGIGYLKLCASTIPPHHTVSTLGDRRLIRFRNVSFGSQAYVVSREGARSLLRSMRTIVRPIDNQLDCFWEHGVASYALFPFPVLALHAPSQIARPVRSGECNMRAIAAMHAHRLADRARKVVANQYLRSSDRDLAGRLESFLDFRHPAESRA